MEIQFPSNPNPTVMKSIFSDLSIAESDSNSNVLLADDFTDQGILDPVPPSKPQKSEEDPIAVMRKIFMGGQVDEMKDRVGGVEKQLAELRETMNQKVQEMERTFREDIARVSKAAADALQAQNDTLTHDIEQTRTNLVTSVDERFRKLSAASVPRSHLAEILRDLSSRLQPNVS